MSKHTHDKSDHGHGADDHGHTDYSDHDDAADAALEQPGCVVPTLPERLRDRAATLAARLNPVNAPFMQGAMPEGGPEIANLALLTSKYWGRNRRTLTVSFMEATANDLKQRILSHMNAWQLGVSFALTGGTAQVRISRAGQGYWSYLGSDILLIPQNRPTMNLQGFTMATADSEYKRVVRHETGHTLGFPHEHLRQQLIARLNVAKTIAYFRDNYGWSEAQTRSNVLTPLDPGSITGTPNADQDSIMCYQLPAQITTNGLPIRGGLDINAADRAFALSVYPNSLVHAPASALSAWDEADDISLAAALDAAHA